MKNDTSKEWVQVAKEVLAGKWKKAGRSTVESIKIGLSLNPHPDAVKALAMLAKKP